MVEKPWRPKGTPLSNKKTPAQGQGSDKAVARLEFLSSLVMRMQQLMGFFAQGLT